MPTGNHQEQGRDQDEAKVSSLHDWKTKCTINQDKEDKEGWEAALEIGDESYL